MSNPPSPLRIGGVPYQVGALLLTGLDEIPEVSLRRVAPRLLAGELRDGVVEAALVSSVEAFRTPGYTAISDLGIACEGPVRSVRLFLRCEPHKVRSVAFDSGSATSVALTTILLRARYGADLAETRTIEPTLQPDAIDSDAVLLIGDAGTKANPGRRRVLDLGEEWYAWKRLPFVFALWLLRADQPRLGRIIGHLHRAWQRGKLAGVGDGTGGSIQYELREAHLDGLAEFRAEAQDLGLCEPGVEPGWTGLTGARRA